MNSNDEIKRFIKEEKITNYPAKSRMRELVLNYLILKFDLNRSYSESEVNEILLNFHTFNDPAFLRRELFEYGLLNRERDGSKYWRTK